MSRKDTKHLPLTPEAKAIDEMAWRGNVTPAEWYLWLKLPSGKTDSVACMILSEIVYWYRGGEVLKGEVVVPGVRARKFNGDVLQKSYEQLMEKFGLSKDQTKRAVLRLEKHGLIKRELRTVPSRGEPLNNVMFLHVFPERLRGITYGVPEYSEDLSVHKSTQAPFCTDPHRPRHRSTYVYKDYCRDYEQRVTS